jgi:steroid delta-isomerase-like uncharacterized protein
MCCRRINCPAASWLEIALVTRFEPSARTPTDCISGSLTEEGDGHGYRHRDREGATTAYNDKNLDKVKEVFAADALYQEPGTHRRIRGVGEIIDASKGWARAIPDSNATLVREFASGGTAVIEVVWKGIQTAALQAPSGIIPASNKPIEVPACQVIQAEGAKVKSFTHYFDMLTPLTQIGAVKG